MKNAANRRLIRSVLLLGLLCASAAAAYAFIPQQVYATPFRFTSTATVSYVDIVLSNSNPIPFSGNLLVNVTLPGGVPTSRTFNVAIPRGNSVVRVIFPLRIQDVRYARVTLVP